MGGWFFFFGDLWFNEYLIGSKIRLLVNERMNIYYGLVFVRCFTFGFFYGVCEGCLDKVIGRN